MGDGIRDVRDGSTEVESGGEAGRVCGSHTGGGDRAASRPNGLSVEAVY